MNTPAKRQNAVGDSAKERILDVAERLFAGRGIANVSIRDITRAAAANLGAINYHFESREKMIVAVFARRISPLNEARLQALDRVEKDAGEKRPKVADILGAFIRPTVEQALNQKDGATSLHALMGRCHAEPEPALQRWLQKEFEPVIKRFDAALRRAVPALPRNEVFWRMQFTVGAMHQTLMLMGKPLPAWLNIRSEPPDQIKWLIAFVSAGMQAPVEPNKS
jgi:AcrR family transcriptional regulator